MTIIEIKKQGELSFGEKLEERAMHVLERFKEGGSSLADFLSDPIALTLTNIKEQRKTEVELTSNLLRERHYVYRELVTAMRDTKYRLEHVGRVDGLKMKLSNLDREVRQVRLTHQQTMRIFHEQLQQQVVRAEMGGGDLGY
jgi:hypothetical protein